MREARTSNPEPRRETEVSRQRQQEAREQVIGPLQRFDEQNHFASVIRASLREERGRQ